MADNYVAVPPDSTATGARKIETSDIVRGDGALVARQHIAIDDGSVTMADLCAAVEKVRDEIMELKWALLDALR